MWLGILTPGAHPCRPVPAPGVATLYCWNDIARMRIDGPADDVAGGLRTLRRALQMRGQTAYDARCFVCGAPYEVPDPVLGRAQAVDWEPSTDVDGEDPDPLDLATPPSRFVLAHLEDHAAPVPDEEVLLVVPGSGIATLVPLVAVSRMLDILGVVLADIPHERCWNCEAVAPAGPRADQAAATRPGRRGRGPGRVRRRAA